MLPPTSRTARARAHCSRTLHKALVSTYCTEAHKHTHDHMYLHQCRKKRRLIHTHVAPNEALPPAHILGQRERTRILPLYVPGFTRAVQGPYTPISTRTNSAHVPRHTPNGVVRPVTVQHDHARAREVSDLLGNLCRHEKRVRPVSVQAKSGGSAGSVTGPGPSNRPREGRPAPSPQGGMEGRIRPQVGVVEALKLKQPVLIDLSSYDAWERRQRRRRPEPSVRPTRNLRS